MRTSVLYFLLLLIFLIGQHLLAQDDETLKYRIEQLETKKTEVTLAEREALKKEVEFINEQLASAEISDEKAQELKKEAAEKRAKNIENKIAIIENTIELLKRQGSADLNTEISGIEIGIGADDDQGDVLFGIKYNTGKQNRIVFDKRTNANLVVAAGLNNAVGYGTALPDAEYKYMGSRFFELGYAWNTRVLKNSNWLRVKYGFSFQFNGLKPTDERIVINDFENESFFSGLSLQTTQETYGINENLKKSKLRMDSFIFPLHFEIGPSEKSVNGKYVRYNTDRHFKFGIGGYVGLNYKTIQKLKFPDTITPLTGLTEEESNAIWIQNARKIYASDYDSSKQRTIWGVSTYAGIGDVSLYFKYELSPILERSLKQYNISFGLRFDL